MHKLADLRTSRTLRNSLVVPRNLDYREHGALSGSRKASEVSRETGFFQGEIQPAFLLHSTCKVSGVVEGACWNRTLTSDRPTLKLKGKGLAEAGKESASPLHRVHPPRAPECDLVWTWGLCRCHLLKDLEIRSH